MSVISAKTGLSSILKAYTPSLREKAKTAAVNKVRFELPKLKGVLEVVRAISEDENYELMSEFVQFLQQIELTDDEFINIFTDARKVCTQLSPKFTNLVEALLARRWINRSQQAVQAFVDFAIDLLVAHNKYVHFLMTKLIALWTPADAELEELNEQNQQQLEAVQLLLARIVTVIPMSFDLVLKMIDSQFPYFKKSSHVVASYVHNALKLVENQPEFTEFVMQILFQKLVILDVNAPRAEIEDAEYPDEEDDCETDDENEDEELEANEKLDAQSDAPMNHAIAHTLDLCMQQIFEFLTAKKAAGMTTQNNFILNQFFKVILQTFDNVLLPCHNTHHVQFAMFYYCSFKQSYAQAFLASLMSKVLDPNTSAIIRQNSVGYIASFLARAKYLPITLLQQYLKELCKWAHQYVERCDQYGSNGSLRANIVFFSVCQAIFYVLAFRSRVLTADKKGLLFLQSLRLSALVTCNLNPLRFCLPAVATAFAGVTRAHQLAYCHVVLERNARRKLATVYTNGTETAEDTLDIFFPFDPYLLKSSNKHIQPIYMQYQPSDADEESTSAAEQAVKTPTRRRRADSEMFDGDDIDDFLFAEKRKKLAAQQYE